MKVVFNVVSEFIEELREEANNREVMPDRVVRLTVLYQSVRELPPLQSVTVVAGAVVRGTLLELRCYCGDTMTGGPRWKDDDQVKQKVRETMDGLKAEAVQLQLTVRKGMYSA